MVSRYLNTDLDIESREDLSPLVPFFEEHSELLHAEKLQDGKWILRVEASGSGNMMRADHSPARDIDELLNVIGTLSNSLKRLLLGAEKCDFNIGWEMSKGTNTLPFNLKKDLLNRMSALGATVTVTVYPVLEN